jgi:photosystem II stability/assembly factor-like uncharacterized protein
MSTHDAGATWTIADVLGGAMNGIGGTIFGEIDIPDAIENATGRWLQVAAHDSSVVAATLQVTGTVDAASSTTHYLVVLDRAAATVRTIPLPMWTDTRALNARPPVFVLSQTTAIVSEYEWDTYLGLARLKQLWRTEDAGATWTRQSDAWWVDVTHLQFFSPTFGITTNATTTDFGRTWQPSGRPFGRVLFALDSTRWMVADSFMLVGRTVDAGRTWTRESTRSPFRAIIASRGNVAIAREHRSVLLSSDAGVTWSDVGASGGVPDDLVQIVAMTLVDTLEAPGSVVGIGAFVDEARRRTARLVTSEDYGRTWREGARIPSLDSAVFSPTLIESPIEMRAIPGIEGDNRMLFVAGAHGLITSDDDGATWERRTNELSIHSLAMASRTTGVAISADWTIPEISLHMTTDAGSSWTRVHTASEGYVFPMGIQLLEDGYRVVVSNYSTIYRNWIVLTSPDGVGWSATRGAYSGPALRGGDAYWTDPRRVHVVGRGASILFSSDAGASLELHHREEPRFFHRHRLDPDIDSLARPLMTARDGRDIYVATYYRDLGKWTIGDGVLATDSERLSSFGPGLSARASPDGTALTLRATSRTPITGAWLVDALGRRTRVALESDGAGRYLARIALSDRVAGRYFFFVRTDEGSGVIPVLVGR